MNNLIIDKKKILIILFSWQIAGILVSLIISIPEPSFHTFFDQVYISLTFINSVALICAALVWIYKLVFRNRKNSTYILIPYLIIGVTAAVAVSLKFAVFCGSYFCGLDQYQVNLWHLLIISLNIILITSFSLICLLYFLHLRLTSSLEIKLQENEQLKRLQLESKLSVLQSKVNPHFLFNTLNTMLGMVRNQPEKVEKIILNLSDIYRKVLSLPENALIRLEDELKLINEYLEIEQSRMDTRLDYKINVDHSLLEAQIPPLILQILVENAIIHGLSPQKKGGIIELDIRHGSGYITLSVADNGAGLKPDFRATGYGLYNIEQRLKLVYGGKAVFEILPRNTGGTIAALRLPYED